MGMSLVAIDNALKSNIMQERFLRDRAMGAFRELLQEKVPVGAPVMRPDRSHCQRSQFPSLFPIEKADASRSIALLKNRDYRLFPSVCRKESGVPFGP